MILHKKKIFGANVSPACIYCEFGRKATDPSKILCNKKGVVAPYDRCRKFCYDPLKRIPRRQPKLPKFSPEDFSLD